VLVPRASTSGGQSGGGCVVSVEVGWGEWVEIEGEVAVEGDFLVMEAQEAKEVQERQL
jgi:hypothetical protein